MLDQKEAEDASQEVFIKIYKALPQYQNQGLKTWMTRIAVNHAIDIKRKYDRRNEEVTSNMEEDTWQYKESNSIENEVMKKEQRRRVHEKINDLPDNYRKVIYDYYIAGKSYQQIAQEQKLQIKTIETKLYRARMWMKKHWKEEDFL